MAAVDFRGTQRLGAARRVMEDNCLVIMARAPVAGRVKTRLIPALGRHGALRVYQALLYRNVTSLSGSAGGGGRRRVYLFCAPSPSDAFFTRLRLRFGVRLMPQTRGDLGRKMHASFAFALRRCRRAVIIGSDVANITPRMARQAFAELSGGADLVLGVADDGGYGLIGMNKPCAALFRGIRWGGGNVAAITLQRARRAGLRVAVLAGVRDVDVYCDYRQWIKDERHRAMLRVARW